MRSTLEIDGTCDLGGPGGDRAHAIHVGLEVLGKEAGLPTVYAGGRAMPRNHACQSCFFFSLDQGALLGQLPHVTLRQ